MDWFGVTLVWVGAIVMAVKSGGLDLMHGAPDWLAAGWWGYVPLVLITAGTLIFIWRALRPRAEVVTAPPAMTVSEETPASGKEEAVPRVQGIPNTKLANVFDHIIRSEWGRDHGKDFASVDQELRDKLHLKRLWAWGRIGEDGKLDPILVDIWEAVRFRPDTGDLHTTDGNVMYSGVQFNAEQVKSLWPISTHWMAR